MELTVEYINQSLRKIEPIGVLIGGVVNFLIGPLSYRLLYLLVFVMADTISGVILAKKEKKFNVKIFFKKIGKKLLNYTMFIVLTHSLDEIALLPGTARWLAVFGMVSIEFSSFLKNTFDSGNEKLAKLGRNILKQISNISGNTNINTEEVDKSNKTNNNGAD